jgi:hypothetical protein
MRQIAIICLFFVVVLLAIVGCLTIFGVIEFAAATSYMLKFGGAIVLLGACAALVSLLMRGRNKPQG